MPITIFRLLRLPPYYIQQNIFPSMEEPHHGTMKEAQHGKINAEIDSSGDNDESETLSSSSGSTSSSDTEEKIDNDEVPVRQCLFRRKNGTRQMKLCKKGTQILPKHAFNKRIRTGFKYKDHSQWKDAEAIDFFAAIATKDFWSMIVDGSNQYRATKIDAQAAGKRHFTEGSYKNWFACVLLKSISHKDVGDADCFGDSWGLSNEYMKSLTNLSRYSEHWQFLHPLPQDPDDPHPNAVFGGIQRMDSFLQRQINLLYQPGEAISVDESREPFFGRFKHRTTMRGKPVKSGLTVRAICDARTKVMVGWDLCDSEARSREELDEVSMDVKARVLLNFARN